MKKSLLLLPFLFLSLPNELPGDGLRMETLSLEEIASIYDEIVQDNLVRIQASGTNGVVTNVYPVYMAGYLHSQSAISILLERLEWEGTNEPIRYYYRPPATSPDGTPVIRIGMGSNYPRPPTPSVGALTQIPVSWETLQSELMGSNPSSRRAKLIAWVAAVQHPSEFSSWMDASCQTNPSLWADLASYASTNLVGRKPFAMDFYRTCPGFCCRDSQMNYDKCISELRRRVAEEESGAETGLMPAILSVLHLMGQNDHELTPEELRNSVERVLDEEVDVISEVQDNGIVEP